MCLCVGMVSEAAGRGTQASIARTVGLREYRGHVAEVEGAQLVLQVRHVGCKKGEVVRTVALGGGQKAAVSDEAPELAGGLQVEPAGGGGHAHKPA